jgi:hypothetical protein
MRCSKSPALALLLAQGGFVAAWLNWDVATYGTVDTFKWQKPFPEAGMAPGGFKSPCINTVNFKAKQYKLSDLQKEPPDGLLPWAGEIDYILHSRMYPGSWDGANIHGDKRDVAIMEYKDVPQPVKKWIENQRQIEDAEKQTWFHVWEKKGKEPPKAGEEAHVSKDEDKVLFFAPGQLYDILPLWVAEGSKCKGMSKPHHPGPS